MLTQAGLFLLDTLVGFLTFALLLRFYLQAFRVSFRNQVGAFVVQLTNWLVVPLRKLLPGLFGDMRLASSGTTPALLVPDSAVQSDQARKTVLVVDADGNVAAKPVTVGAAIDGLRIIRGGLTADDRPDIVGVPTLGSTS